MMAFMVLGLLLGVPCLAMAQEPANGPFVVVELFSSEGCSSCPAADLLVSKLTAWARETKRPIYPLIFHVDYWNNLGWRDVFSSPQSTQRQYAYARVFKDQGVYTPEMVVNGADAFVGSDQEHLQMDLNRALTNPAGVGLQISLDQQDHQVLVHYSVKDYGRGDTLNIALVQRGLSTDVTAGENAGRTLHHDNVVREFQTFSLAQDQGQAQVPLDKINDPSQASVIVFVQNPQSMVIEAAQQMDLAHA